MAIGLDIGTAFIVSANEKGEIKKMRDGFIDVSVDEVTLKIMSGKGVNWVKIGGTAYVLGEEALSMAVSQNKEMRRPMHEGILSPLESRYNIAIFREILRVICGKPSKNDEIIVYSVPAKPVNSNFNVIYHEDKIKEFLESFGYKARSINEGLAVIYSELEKNGFTGIATSWGAGCCNVCFAINGMQVFKFSVSHSGDWLDSEVAKSLNLKESYVQKIKEEKLELNVITDDPVLNALQLLYDRLVTLVINTIKQYMLKESFSVLDACPVVISGGTSIPKGFDKLVEKRIKEASLPIEIGEVKYAVDKLNAVAKGALYFAMKCEE